MNHSASTQEPSEKKKKIYSSTSGDTEALYSKSKAICPTALL